MNQKFQNSSHMQIIINSESKFFKDQKWSAKEKMAQWLLCNGEDIIWIVGHRADRRFLTTDKSPKLKLTLT